MIKKNIALTIGAAMLCSTLAANVAQAGAKKIAIANFGAHVVLESVRDSFKKEMKALQGADVTFDYAHVNWDPSLVPQMIQKMKAGKPDAVLTITTPVSQGSVQVLRNSGIPIVFAAVTDPVAAKLVPSWTQGASIMTGASDMQSIDGVLAFIRKLLPESKRLGLPYNPGEDNDVAMRGLFEGLASKHGFELIPVGIDTSRDIPQRLQALNGKADAIYVPASNLLQSSLPAISATAHRMKMPLINGTPDQVVEHQMLASFAVDYEKVGVYAAQLMNKILTGAKTADLAPIRPSFADHKTQISQKRLDALGIKLPASLKDCNCVIQ